MGAALCDHALVEHDDLVGIDDGGEAVGDHHGGAVARDLLQRHLDFLFGEGVERRSGLVEDEDGRPFENGTGDGNALLLAARELEAAFTHHRVVALRQRHHEVVDLGKAGRLFDLGIAGAGTAIGDVVADGVVEEHGILRHHAECTAQAFLGHALDVLPVDADAARGDIVETEDEARDRRLAGPRGSDDRHRLARGHGEGDAAQDGALLVIGEAHVIKDDLPLAGHEGFRARAVGNGGVLAQDREHAFNVDEALLDLAVGGADEVERHVELDHQRIDHDEVADGERAREDLLRCHDHHEGEADRIDDGLSGVEHRERDPGLDRGLLVARHGDVIAVGLVALVAEVLHRLEVEQAVDRLGAGVVVGLVHGAADADAAFRGPVGEADIGNDGGDDHPDIEMPEGIRDDAADERDLERRREGVEKGEAQDRIHAVDATRDDAREGAGAAAEMEGKRELVQVAEGFVGKLAHRALAHLREDGIAHLGEDHHEDAAHAIGQHHEDRHREQCHLDTRLGGERIGCGLEGVGRHHRHELGGHQQQHGDDHADLEIHAPHRPEIGHQMLHGLPLTGVSSLPVGGRGRHASHGSIAAGGSVSSWGPRESGPDKCDWDS